ncbi:hypothetical protein [Streptomyces radicis]|nr:hypothetical protein [Streptomyces radicis]
MRATDTAGPRPSVAPSPHGGTASALARVTQHSALRRYVDQMAISSSLCR